MIPTAGPWRPAGKRIPRESGDDPRPTTDTDRDLPTVQTIVMVLVIFAVVVNAMVDVAYAVVDPRTRSEVTA